MVRRCCALLLLVCGSLVGSRGEARTWTVAADGSGDFTLLSAAYAAAASGDTVLIRPGHYQEPGFDGCDDTGMRVTAKSLTTIGTGDSPSAVSIGEMIVFSLCPETVVQNLYFHNTWGALTVYSTSGSDHAQIRNCMFEDNGHDCSGSALMVTSWNATIESCTFRRNSCGAVDDKGAGLNVLSEGQVTMRDCFFEGNNAADAGGAVGAWGDGVVLERCVFLGNTAARGGAIYSADAEIRNCSFWGNQGDGTIYLDGPHGDNLHNCIVAGTHGGPGVRCGPMHFSGKPWCCDLWSNEGEEWCTSGGTGNFSLDPMFCDPNAGDLTLQDGSPCLDGNASGYRLTCPAAS